MQMPVVACKIVCLLPFALQFKVPFIYKFFVMIVPKCTKLKGKDVELLTVMGRRFPGSFENIGHPVS